jgi:hypothetical protein
LCISARSLVLGLASTAFARPASWALLEEVPSRT